MSRDRTIDTQTLNAVLQLAQNRDFDGAAGLAKQALADGFEHPLLLNVLATQCEHRGQLEEARRLLERGVAIAPADVGTRNALSLCLQRLNRPAEALVHVEELLKNHPELAFAHANKGNALIDLGWLGRAKLSHQRALELEPGNFVAMAALASIAAHRGEHDEARRWAEQALTVVPGYPEAVLSLAGAQLADGETAPAEAQLRKLLADPRAGESDKARASGLLGDVLDASGRFKEAFDAYSACNESLRQIHRRFAAGSDMGAGVLAYTRSLIAATQGESLAAPQSAAPVLEPAGHVFLLGFPRSGTTLLEVVLDGNPHVVSVEEHELLTEAVLRFMQEPLDLARLARAGESELNTLRAAYWERVSKVSAETSGKIFVDKHPLNTLKLPLIARLFPQAKILFACRDPRDVVFSCFRRRFKMNAAMYELLTLSGAADFYAAVMRFAEQMRPQFARRWKVVRYEGLVDDFAGETRDICEFLGVVWNAGMGDFGSRVQLREHATPSTAQLARGLKRTGLAQWRHYEESLRPVLPVLQPWVEALGYADR